MEKCIWKKLLDGGNKLYRRGYYKVKGDYSAMLCDKCNGRTILCNSYLSNREIDKRGKERELENILQLKLNL